MKLRDEYLYWQSVKLAHPYGRKGHLKDTYLKDTPVPWGWHTKESECAFYISPLKIFCVISFMKQLQIKDNKMKKKLNNPNIANTILWAAAILSAAILDAPQFLTIIILPVLGLSSIINVKRCT